jgi:acetoacetate decarboxylase
MGRIRYGAKADDERRNRELEATGAKIWSHALTAIYETDPEVVAAVLPPPLEPPAEPLVRITLTAVTMPGLPTFGAGYVAVRARHEGTDGEYPLFMPMSTEQATVGGRETYGEPKKIAEVVAVRDGDQVHGRVSRLGFTPIEIRGRITGPGPVPPPRTKTDFYFKFLMSPDGKGFDHDPALVYCHKEEEHRSFERIDGEVVLRESPLDPVVDLPVLRLVDLNWSERATVQRGEIHSWVASDDLLPYVHQRYDDLSVLGAAD